MDSGIGMTFDKLRDIHFVADPNIHRDAGILLAKSRVLSDLSIIRNRKTDLMPAFS